MAFETRKGMNFNNRLNTSKDAEMKTQNNEDLSPNTLNSLVDQIADAVREKLISQGVPLMPMESAVGKNAPPSRSDSGSSTSSSRWNHAAIPVNSIRKASFEPHLFEGQESLARKIDHTLLKPDATPEQIRKVCEEARKYQFATVCVNSSYVKTVADLLKGSATVPIAVVGFPLGASSTASKVFETNEAIKNGAGEIDMVINIGALKAKDYAHVLDDISAVVDAAAPVPVKVILETAELTQEEKVIGCALTKAADAAFVKTSTGFASGGATVEDIELMRRIVGDEMGVKASGGIRTQEDAKKMIQAGASRIGASASVAIVTGTSEKKDSKNKSYKSSLY